MTNSGMVLAMASDHGGYEMKEFIKAKLIEEGYEIKDFGTHSIESVDYADMIHPAAKAINDGTIKRGIIFCGSGNGAQMTANKYPNVRAGLCWTVEQARLIREHNNANIISIPGRFVSFEEGYAMAETFLTTDFEGGRHIKRVEKNKSNPKIRSILKSSPEKIAFLKAAEKISFDKEHRETINYNISKYNSAVEKGQAIYSNIELARKRAGYLKYKVINDLDKYLIEFEDNFTKNGGKIIWAQDAKEAISEIKKIINHHQLKKVVKSKSMLTEEIELNAALEKTGLEVNETDLGEFIVQNAGQKPYHIVTPAMHMSKEDVAQLYTEKFDTDADLSPEELTLFTRDYLRNKFIESDLGVSGANFLIADTGSVALTENEGNAMLSMSFPKIRIAISGIEKIIPNMEDLDLFWPLLSTHGTGQYLSAYNSIISGPRSEGEKNGPEEMYLVLIDNGRSNLLAQKKQRQALSCIKCGACLNSCPVYKNVGGHTYDTTYSGPIGAVITPYIKNFKAYNHLSFASTLCGKCTTVCPVKIPLHELLLLNRNDAVKRNVSTFIEKQTNKWSTVALGSRNIMDMTKGSTKTFLAKQFGKKAWGPRREMPEFAPKSFSQMWKEKSQSPED